VSTHLRITLFSHYFKVDKLSLRGREFCKQYAQRFIPWGFRQERGRSHRFKDVDNVFASAGEKGKYYRFHINALAEFKKYLQENWVTPNLIEWGETPKFRPVAIAHKVKEGWNARGNQQSYIDYLSSKKPVCKLLPLQTGKGKSLSLDSKIKIPGGWKKMGDIKLGDVVCTPSGKKTTVIGVYPQGKLQAYVVHFEDGREVKCSADHLWTVLIKKNEAQLNIITGVTETTCVKQSTVDANTSEIAELLDERRLRVFTPHVNNLCDYPDIPISSEVYEALAFGSFIPDKYLYSSIDTKIKLLKSICDFCGTSNTFGTVSFHTKSDVLAQFVKTLIFSIGGVVFHEPVSFGTKLRIKLPQLDWIIAIAFNGLELDATAIDRLEKNSVNEGVEIVSITSSYETPMQCIEVDDPDSLYITNNYISTHNTFCALKAAALIGQRIGVVVQSKYIDKWIGDLKKTYDIDKDRILVISGNVSLKALFEHAKNGTLEADVIVFSLNTLSIWLNLYEQIGDKIIDQGYAYTPENWLQALGIGVRLIDEVHQHYRAIFMLDLYTHVEYSMCLSATLVTKNPFIAKMYNLQYPKQDRCVTEEIHRYAKSYAVHYNFDKPSMIRTREFGSTNYSHNCVEESILRHYPTKERYFKLIDEVLRMSYFSHRKQDKKAVVFCASVEMCTKLTEHFKKKYPSLDIRRYVGEDPYENAIDADIRFTTPGSCGAAIDIPDLVTCFLTQAISSIQANIQILGRLREIPGEDVEFFFLTADNIDKHVEYYEEKKNILRDRALSFRDVFIGYYI
jgi:superfamily II DNA or RNA helicase